jgi:Protein of unknown function (DUF2563)
MFVDTALLHSGANESHRASWYADEGANHLARKPPVASMFGDFTAAHSFHEAVSAAHAHHARILHAHREALSAVGGSAQQAAAEFTEMDERNTAKLRAVRCSSDT